ncbi:unnamed protein product [Oncorhynchus mykiss]|uniref:Protein S-acyltransferase n=1 Tax=Oncorhynchus mykiss TaxID=8022 RepID=A0A060W3S1_ONCMY|nr:unnamed protein product [Oncorhynchus mykiss]
MLALTVCGHRLDQTKNSYQLGLRTFPFLNLSFYLLSCSCPFLASNLTPAIPVIGGVLFFFVLGMLFRASFSDPGVLPRATPDEAADLERQIGAANGPSGPGYRPPPRTREVVINGQTVKLKYCFTCKIFRPPRASHCSLCDNCVEQCKLALTRIERGVGGPGAQLSKRTSTLVSSLTSSFMKLYPQNTSLNGARTEKSFDWACMRVALPWQHMGCYGDGGLSSLTVCLTVLEVLVCFFSVWSIVGLSGFHTYLISSNQTTNEDIKGLWSNKRAKDNYNPYSYGNIMTNCCAALCGPLPPSLIDRRGFIQSDTPQPVSHSNGSSMYASTQLHTHMCDQEHCIQSTKFVLQAAATPLLHSNSVMIGGGGPPFPGKSSLVVPCASLAPSQPSLPSMPGLSCAGDMLTLRDPDTHCHHHHFASPEETPSPSGPMPLTLPCAAHMTHGGHIHPAQLYDPASQDSLHEDSVRGLVKLSSV